MTPVTSQVTLKRGTNISHWLSQSEDRGEARLKKFTYDDVQRLAGLGFNHLRLPVDEEQLWTIDGKPDIEAMDLLDQGIDWILDAGMNVVVDLHILRSHHFNEGDKALFGNPDAIERFAQCWRDLSDRLRRRPENRLAYELMNEPVADDPNDWNRVLLAPYNAVREREPTRTILIGSNLWCTAAQFAWLDVPAGDPNIVLTFHYYDPMLVTHYRAPWTPDSCIYQGPIQYPGVPVVQDEFDKLPIEVQRRITRYNPYSDRETMRAGLMWPLAVRARTGLPLYCGEFGVNRRAPADICKRWTRDFRSLLEELDISWANWDLRGDFGLFHHETNEDTVVVEALLGDPPAWPDAK